jgi:hypothetical protein
MKNRLIAALVSSVVLSGCATGMGSFGADLGAQSAMGQTVRAPYTDVISYYGYVSPTGKPDEVKDGKNMYYLYLWVPAVAPELGVRMVSPVKSVGMKPAAADFVSADFTANADSADFFDTWVRVERCLAAVSPEDISKPCEKWVTYGENDDSSELPAQPSGSKYNSVMRITSEASDPLKALVRGMYRIGFTTFKTGEVKGTFVAQVGSPVKLPGTTIAKTTADLAAEVAKAK